jgi:hypothetical protein
LSGIRSDLLSHDEHDPDVLIARSLPIPEGESEFNIHPLIAGVGLIGDGRIVIETIRLASVFGGASIF